MVAEPDVRPSGVVSFVLTDVVNSTGLWESASAAMDGAIRRCEELIGGAVGVNRGWLLKSRGEGDSTLSVFSRATDAVRAALTAQQSLLAERWPQETPICVRFAVHTGEAIDRDGDYFGPAVNRAARLRSIAEGGQVVVSRATAELCTGQLDVGVELLDLGEQRLRGLERPESVYALVGPGVPEVETARAPRPGSSTSVLDARGVTRKEREVLAAVGERLTNPEIARRLYVSPRTVESHVSSLLRKLDAANRRDLADRARELLRDHVGGPDPVPRAPLPAPVELLVDPRTYVGRQTERALLRHTWQRTIGGLSSVIVVAGEAGIGKSRVVAEFAAEVHGEGGQVLFGACFEESLRPYEPFAHALVEQAATLPAPELRRRAGAGRAPLVDVVPELSPLLHATPRHEPAPDAIEHTDALDALAGYVTRAADIAPVLFVVEDLHWSTSTTRDAIRHLARRGGHAPMLVLATTRDGQPDLDDATAVLLADLGRLPGVETITLAGLTRSEVVQLVAKLDASGDPHIIYTETRGNPLFVGELARMQSGGVGGSVAGILARRYAHLDASDLALLDVASVLGTEFGADLVAAAADLPLVDTLEALERAEAAGLVAALPGRPGRFAFAHALFRSARYDALTLARRLRLHRGVAEALERRGDDAAVAELARHSCIAAPLGGARKAIDHARRVGEAAALAPAPAEAADHYERALEAAKLLDPQDPELSLDLAIRYGEMLHRAGDRRYREVLRAAADVARAHSDPARLGLAAAAMIQYGIMTTGLSSDSEFVAIAEEALAGLGNQPTPTRARLQAALATEVMHLDPGRARSLVEDATDIARALGDPVTLGDVLYSSRFAGQSPDDLDSTNRTADELIDIGHRTAQKTFTIVGLETRAAALREAGDLVGCDHAVETYAALLGTSALPHVRAFLALFRSGRRALSGDLAAAERAAREILALAKRGSFDPANWYGSALWTIRHNQHRLARFAPFYRRGVLTQPGLDDYLSAILALAQLQAGRTDDARAELDRFAATDFVGVRPNFLWTVKLAMLCEVAEKTGHAAAGAQLLELLRPRSGALAANGVLVFEPIDLALAQAALAAGECTSAETFAVRAAAASRRRRTPIFLGRELIRVAAARQQLGGDRESIAGPVSEALDIADGTGAALIRREAEHHQLCVPVEQAVE